MLSEALFVRMAFKEGTKQYLPSLSTYSELLVVDMAQLMAVFASFDVVTVAKCFEPH